MNENSSMALLTTNIYHRQKRMDHIQSRDHGFAAWMVGISFVGDILATVVALLLAFWVRFHTPLREFGRTDYTMVLEAYRGHIVFLSITFLLLLAYFELYSVGRPLRLRKVIAIVVTSSSIWFLAHLALSFELNSMPIVSRIFLLTSFVCTTFVVSLWRYGFDCILGIRSVAALLQRRILFVGWSEQVVPMLEHIDDDPKHPYQIIGCVSSVQGGFDLAPPASVEQLGGYVELQDILIREAIDIVIVADLYPTRGSLQDLVALCEKEIVHLQIVPSCFQVLASGLHLETTSGVPVLGITRLPLDSLLHQCLKRTVDVVGSLIGLLLSAPLITIFAALVYWESPGPVFYRQVRSGIGGKLFYILKIRSMRLDAERNHQPGWSQHNDPRRLKIGAFMRSWNIDEIPQFLNVLIGDMSLVGPRPERPEFIADFKERIPHYNARHGVKPGISGWAQINGFRGDTDLTERIKCDLFYIENWSLLLDVQIMLMTFFKRRNAS